jgi:oxaloacetate decarboxylase gamma subunit
MENLQQLIIESLELLFLGMGTVFLILIMLIFLITLVSRLVAHYPDEPPGGLVRKPVTVTSNPHVAEQDELVAVISAAVSVYRQRRQ